MKLPSSDASNKTPASPEELDRCLVVVSSQSWLALLLTCLLVIGAILWAFFGTIPNTFETSAIYLNTEGFETLNSHWVGKVKRLHVKLNQEITEGEVLAHIEEKSGAVEALLATSEGKVIDILAQKGASVNKDDPLFLIEKKEGGFAFFSFVPIERGQQLKPGMPVYIKPEGVDAQQYGSIQASIQSIAPYVATQAELKLLLGNPLLIQHLTENQPVLIVVISAQHDANTVSGFRWTSGFGPQRKISPFTIGSALFILESRHPISYVIPIWRVKKIVYDVKKE